MTLRRTQVVIALLPSGVRGATIAAGGEIVRADRIPLPTGAFETAWLQGLRPLDEPLRMLRESLGVQPGARTIIAYSSPSLLADIFVSPTVGPNAVRAAELSLRQNIAGDAAEWETQTATWASGEAAAGAQQHLLTAADRRSAIDAMGAWLRRANMTPVGCVPIKLAVADAALRASGRVTSDSSDSKAPVMYLGEHTSVLLRSSGSGLEFVRAIDIGYALLAEAVARGAAGAGVTLPSGAHASRLLFAHGIPKKGQTIDPALGLRAEAVLPLLQSAVQRFGVEARQTLRFALPEGELHRTSIRLMGPGATIRGLASALTAYLDVPVDAVDEARGDTDLEDPLGDLADAISMRQVIGAFVPACQREQTGAKQTRVATLCGAAMAIAMLGAGYWATLKAEHALLAQESEQAPAVEAMNARAQAAALDGELSAEMSRVAKDLNEALGKRPIWAQTLASLSTLTGGSITLAEITGGYPPEQRGNAVLTLRGMASPGADTHSSDELAAFVERIADQKQVINAGLTSTRAMHDGAGVERTQFVVAVTLKSSPVMIPDVGVVTAVSDASADAGRTR